MLSLRLNMAAALRTAGALLRDRSKWGCLGSSRRRGPCDRGDSGQLPVPCPPAWGLPGAARTAQEAARVGQGAEEGWKGPSPGRVLKGPGAGTWEAGGREQLGDWLSVMADPPYIQQLFTYLFSFSKLLTIDLRESGEKHDMILERNMTDCLPICTLWD